MRFEKFGTTPDSPAPAKPEKVYSAWEDEARDLETTLRDRTAEAAKMTADAEAVSAVLQLAAESFELASRSPDERQRQAAAETLRSIAANQNFLRSLETGAEAARTASAELEREIKRLRLADAHFDKLIVQKLKEQRPEDLH